VAGTRGLWGLFLEYNLNLQLNKLPSSLARKIETSSFFLSLAFHRTSAFLLFLPWRNDTRRKPPFGPLLLVFGSETRRVYPSNITMPTSVQSPYLCVGGCGRGNGGDGACLETSPNICTSIKNHCFIHHLTPPHSHVPPSLPTPWTAQQGADHTHTPRVGRQPQSRRHARLPPGKLASLPDDAGSIT
jgi:hypothetical protein